jgi:hypothetical protein
MERPQHHRRVIDEERWGRISQLEQGKVSGQEIVARYAVALGGRLHQAIYFDDGDITAIA